MTTFNTNWVLNGRVLEPDLTNEPAPPEGMVRTVAAWDTPHCNEDGSGGPQPGDPVEVTLSYTEAPIAQEVVASTETANASNDLAQG